MKFLLRDFVELQLFIAGKEPIYREELQAITFDDNEAV